MVNQVQDNTTIFGVIDLQSNTSFDQLLFYLDVEYCGKVFFIWRHFTMAKKPYANVNQKMVP